ncbi:MAG: carbohydrate ABC transporter permease [Clostridiales bacterium]|nr:carbohydrate ABC transporter permease [Clostridiales bacterium]
MILSKKKNDIIGSFSDGAFYALVYVFALVAFFITLYPFVYVLAVSMSGGEAINKGIVWLYPVDISFEGYKQVMFNNKSIWLAYGNTIYYTVVGTVFNIVATVIAAYPLSRTTFSGRRFFNFLIAFVMYFHGGLIPTYLLITNIGLYNSRWVMIIPGLVTSYNVMVCRSAFSAIPDEIMESASIDGANDIHILSRIAIKLITPTLAVITLYYAVSHWNNFFTALLYISDSNLHPLQVLLRRVLIQASSELMDNSTGLEEKLIVSLQVRYVTIVVATLPILAIYPFLQKYFVKGVMLGAVKG